MKNREKIIVTWILTEEQSYINIKEAVKVFREYKIEYPSSYVNVHTPTNWFKEVYIYTNTEYEIYKDEVSFIEKIDLDIKEEEEVWRL